LEIADALFVDSATLRRLKKAFRDSFRRREQVAEVSKLVNEAEGFGEACGQHFLQSFEPLFMFAVHLDQQIPGTV
jgi:hypothetical protein